MKLAIRAKGFGNRLGMTLAEVVVASAIGMMIAGSMGAVMMQVAREHRRGLIEYGVLKEADRLQDQLTQILRGMSVNQGVIYAGEIAEGVPLYHRVLVSTDSGVRQELTFDADLREIVHDSDVNQGEGLLTLIESSEMIQVEECYFYSPCYPGGIPDSSAINVYFEISDNYSAGYRQEGQPAKVRFVRTFTVKLKN